MLYFINVGSFGVDPRREAYAGEDVAGVSVPSYQEKYISLQEVVKANYKFFEVDYYGIDNDDYVAGVGFCCEPQAQTKNARSIPTENVDYEKLQYYYHSDHLGSASYITNLDGEVVQHIEYVPFGEVFLEERNNTWNTPFLFNGKELDEETGLYYYGARYYNPRISLWYGVDPLAEKYPSMSPYNYCANNPIKYIDPDGERIRVADLESFNVLLSSLPAGARDMIKMNSEHFIDASSVNAAYSQFSKSGNLKALRHIVADQRIVEFTATSESFKYVNSETNKTGEYDFASPVRGNFYQEALSDFKGSLQDKQIYAQTLLKAGILDETTTTGNFGATLRPSSAQEPYPGGQISTSNNFEVYINPVGTTPVEKAKNVGHELFGHLFFWFIGKDPRHLTNTSNPELNRQILDREKESEQNIKH